MNWTHNATADDLTAKTEDGFILRVEQMDVDLWWWDVYKLGCIRLSFRDDNQAWTDAPSKDAAMWAAQCAYQQMKQG